jgi:type I pantothenate kinase
MPAAEDRALIDELCTRALTRTDGARPVIGIAGSVAVGKSSMAARLAAGLSDLGARAVIVGTDGFLFPNSVLRARHLYLRKGFPETYDEERLVAFIRLARTGVASAEIPVYSHSLFDVDGLREAELGDVVIVEGVNALQPAVARELSHRIYVDADEPVIFRWYADRFAGLIEQAEVDERSFYRQFAPLDPEARAEFIQQVWDGINRVNLHDHIVHTRAHADTVIHLRADHSIERLEHQEQP